MHIVIAALTSLATILWLLDRLGIDLGGLNPWAWRRRSRWRSAFEANPIYAITSPMELAAVLVAATAKADGDMSLEEKQAILELFTREFRLSEKDAASLLASSTHLLGQGEELYNNLADVIKPSKDSFTPTQAESTVAMVEAIAAIGGQATSVQTEFVERVRGELLPAAQGESQWT
jgi:uncharacterized tellurite resistance protein B-like protein